MCYGRRPVTAVEGRSRSFCDRSSTSTPTSCTPFRTSASRLAFTSCQTRSETRSFQRGSCSPRLRPRVRPALLAHSRSVRTGDERIPDVIHRQMQSGSFLLGKLRSGGNAFFGASRATVSRRRRRAESPRGGGFRHLFP